MTALQGAPFRLAALAARRFPEGAALGAYLDGDAGLADYIRCKGLRDQFSSGAPVTPCSWGAEPGAERCEVHKAGQIAQQKRDYKARRAAGVTKVRPPCCSATRKCDQHGQADIIKRGYQNAWAAGARGERRVAWLYELFGQDEGQGWGVRDAAGYLDRSDDGHGDRLRGTPTLYPDLRQRPEAGHWFASHPGWVNHQLPDMPARATGRRRLTASWLRPELDRLGQIHRVRRVDGYHPWMSENVRVLVEEAVSGIT